MKSIELGYKSNGTFYGLKYQVNNKYLTVRITVVDWQLWKVEFNCTTLFIRQASNDTLPSFTLKKADKQKTGYIVEHAYCWEE